MRLHPGCPPDVAEGAGDSEQRWPGISTKGVMKQPPRMANATKSMALPVHERALWFISGCCLQWKNGCQGQFIIFVERDKPNTLVVCFKGPCTHRSDGQPVGQLSGIRRAAAVEAAGSAPPALAHVLAMGKLPAAQQLDKSVAQIGGNPQVLRQALYEDRARQHRRDDDPLISCQLRAKEFEKKDLELTPLADQASRLAYGLMPLFTSLPGGHFVMLLMRETQLLRYLFCRSRGCEGIWADTVGGRVGLYPIVSLIHLLSKPSKPILSHPRALTCAQILMTGPPRKWP